MLLLAFKKEIHCYMIPMQLCVTIKSCFMESFTLNEYMNCIKIDQKINVIVFKVNMFVFSCWFFNFVSVDYTSRSVYIFFFGFCRFFCFIKHFGNWELFNFVEEWEGANRKYSYLITKNSLAFCFDKWEPL